MLHWINGHTRRYKNMNDRIKEKVGVVPIKAKMVESRLKWFLHVCKRPIEALVRRVDQMENSTIARERGRPTKTIGETSKIDLEFNGLNINMFYNRTLWHRLIHVANPI